MNPKWLADTLDDNLEIGRLMTPPEPRYLLPHWGLGLCLCCLLAVSLLGHGDAHDLIRTVSEQLREHPRDSDLYYQRGELYRRHGDFDLALADYERAARYSTNTPMLDLSRGLLLVDAKWPQTAKVYLDRFLARETNHVVALVTRAKAQLQLQNRDAAVFDYTLAIQASREPRPELFIERAQALITDDGGRLDEAIQGLDEGIRRLGSVITLQLYAIDLELKRRQTNAALGRLDGIIAQSPRKETWQARRGEILQQAGRRQEARAAFITALGELGKLPPARRNVPALQELERRIRSAITNLEEAVPLQSVPGAAR